MTRGEVGGGGSGCGHTSLLHKHPPRGNTTDIQTGLSDRLLDLHFAVSDYPADSVALIFIFASCRTKGMMIGHLGVKERK